MAAVALVLFAGQAASSVSDHLSSKINRALRQNSCEGDPRFQDLSQECLKVLNADKFGITMTDPHLEVLCVKDCIGPLYDIFKDCLPDFVEVFVAACSKNDQNKYCGTYLTEGNLFLNDSLFTSAACGGSGGYDPSMCEKDCKEGLMDISTEYGCCFEDIMQLYVDHAFPALPNEGQNAILPHFLDGSMNPGDIWTDCDLNDPGKCPLPEGVKVSAAKGTGAGITIVVLFMALLMLL